MPAFAGMTSSEYPLSDFARQPDPFFNNQSRCKEFMRKRLAVFWIVLAAALLVALAYVMLDRGFLRFNYPGASEFPVRGVDVSHHQGEIDWDKVANQGIQFAYIKASEGENLQDERFPENWSGSSRAAIIPGAYHYYSLCAAPALQAANFLASAPPSGTVSLPPAVDLEFGGNCAKRPSPAAFQADLRVFLAAVEASWNRPVVLYVSPEFFPYVKGRFPGHPVWVRDIWGRPDAAEFGRWQFWQYANRGRLHGISSSVDLDVFAGSHRDFDAFIEPGHPVVHPPGVQ
jgi:lysozyme